MRRPLIWLAGVALVIALLVLLDWIGAVLLVLVGVALVIRGLRRRRRRESRGHVEVIGGPWAWRWLRARQLSHIVREWPITAQAMGVPGAKLMVVLEDHEEGLSVRFSARTYTVIDVNIAKAHSALGVPGVFVIRVPDPERSWEMVLEELPPIPLAEEEA